MIGKGLLLALMSRGVSRRLGWLPLIWMVGRMLKQKQSGASIKKRRY